MSAGSRLRELLERLVAREIRFVIVGGLAVNAWGYVRGTQDVDLVPDPAPDNLDKLATLVSTELGAVDVMQGLPQIPSFGRLDRDAVEVDMDGTIVRVCSLESLLAMKRASERGRDRDDLEALEAAHLPDDGPNAGQ